MSPFRTAAVLPPEPLPELTAEEKKAARLLDMNEEQLAVFKRRAGDDWPWLAKEAGTSGTGLIGLVERMEHNEKLIAKLTQPKRTPKKQWAEDLVFGVIALGAILVMFFTALGDDGARLMIRVVFGGAP